ncbi:uncharacterized protein I206_107257 [Kwoniella pini CBS 10737]|uniref:Uncharacterized protein n=1 Tax=Kwoniella pini CBS 10737 TaxID=1296096 RepID=A0A1B9HYT1_9TREE|nr:uncharacterized protein I206_05198 [Kwoniella pini CBS 10737]OCF48420.1 hypothetical protein I206_05198 [Kwoniella pini CBS 10737]
MAQVTFAQEWEGSTTATEGSKTSASEDSSGLARTNNLISSEDIHAVNMIPGHLTLRPRQKECIPNKITDMSHIEIGKRGNTIETWDERLSNRKLPQICVLSPSEG